MSEFVYPGERSFSYKTPLIDLNVKKPLTSFLCVFAITLVFGDVWYHTSIEAYLAHVSAIKTRIGIEIGPF